MLGHTQIDKIGLYVTDYHRSLIFYRDALNLHVAWENEAEGHAGFQVGHNLLVIQHDADRADEGGARIYFTIDDLEDLQQKVRAAGINASDVHEYDGFRTVDFTDPDGNRLGLFEPTEAYATQIAGYMERHVGS
jgi:catechol 2,3-dioxygenase-like lactoylglutathione lyase family enzyme